MKGVVKTDVRVLEYFIAHLAPDTCITCGVEGSRLCDGCFLSSYERPPSRCYICNKLTDSQVVCHSCRSRSRLRRVWWLGNYEGVLKELIWEMKYQRGRDVARQFGRYLADSLSHLPASTLVTHIPTASSRIRRRGYDQAAVIAQAFAQARRLTYQACLTQVTQTELIGQSRLHRQKLRRGNYRLVQPENLKGASILLIDDVLTTGATLEAAAHLLRGAGARHVDAAVVARRMKQ